MDFGLGLVLSFTDNATAGINNAVNSLGQLSSIAENASTSLNQMASLSALSVIADNVGSSFLNTGRVILSTLGQIINKVNSTGQTLMYAESQLDALYASSGRSGKAIIGQIQDYAKTSMFEFENLIPAVTSLKSVGIEAFDAITSSAGNMNYNLLDYASALASFAPQMTNMYGTGIEAAIGALREYIAEGNARSLLQGAGLKITDILGEEKGTSIEERTRQVADLIEQLGMMGMVDSMKNSPMTQLSNMGDTLFQFLGMVSDSGVYDKFSQLIGKLAEYVGSIEEAELETLAKTVGSALTALMQPLEWIVDKVIEFADSLRKLVSSNPNLIKLITIGGAIAGVFSVLIGVALKATSAFSGLSLMLLTMGKSFRDIGGIIKVGSLKILGTLLPLTATIALLALAWKSDFAGIRTNVTYFMENLVSSFNTARKAVNGSVADLKLTLADLNNKDDFFSNLTVGIMKVMMLFKALADGWNDYTLSEENFLKARELGILPLIEAILDLKYRFDFFKQGFIDGWKEIGENVKTAVMGFLDNIEGTELETLVDNLTEFLQKLASGDPQAWYDFGKAFADFTAKAVAFFVVMKSLDKVLGIFIKVATVISAFAKIGSVFGKIGGFIAKMFPSITKVGGAIIAFGKNVAFAISAVVAKAATIGEAFAYVFPTLAKIVGGFKAVLAVIGSVVSAVLGFFGVVVSAPAWVVGAITVAVVAIVALIVAKWEEISAFLGKIGSWIYTNVIKPVADFFVNLWNGIVLGVTTAFNAVKTFLSTIASWIYTNVIMPVVNFFMTYIYPFIEKIVEIVAKIIEIIITLVSVFVQWVYNSVIVPIAGFFSNLWNGIVTGVQGFISGAKKLFSTVASWVNANVVQPVASFFSNLWKGLVTGVQNFITSLVSFFRSAVTSIKNFFSPLATFFKSVWDEIVKIFTTIGTFVSDAISGAVKGAINGVLSGAATIINGFISALNLAIDIINGIPGVAITKIDKLEVPALAKGGVVDSPTLAMVGEAGQEAVMPLENNTGWISSLANMISTQMTSIRPVSSGNMITTNNQGDTNQRYLTNNSTNSTTYEGDTDNSVVFNEGAIQVTVQNASEEEAIRLAKKVMEYINRQRELDRMTSYA